MAVKEKEKARKDLSMVSRRIKENVLNQSIPMPLLDLFLPIQPGPSPHLAYCMRMSRPLVLL